MRECLLSTHLMRSRLDWDDIGARTLRVLPEHLAGREPCFVVQFVVAGSDESLILNRWDGQDITPVPEEDANAVANMFWDRAR